MYVNNCRSDVILNEPSLWMLQIRRDIGHVCSFQN